MTGIGYGKKAVEKCVSHQDSFDDLLCALNCGNEIAATRGNNKVNCADLNTMLHKSTSLEKKSKLSLRRLQYVICHCVSI